MSGFDNLGMFDYASLFKGLSGGNNQQSGQTNAVAQTAALERRVQEERMRAERMKTLLIAGGSVLGLGGILFLILGRRS